MAATITTSSLQYQYANCPLSSSAPWGWWLRWFYFSLSIPFVMGAWAAPGPNFPPLVKPTTAEHIPLAQKAMDYFNKGTDPFHVVHHSIILLQQAGFQELDDCEIYAERIQPGGSYYFTRNRSTLVAFTVGKHYQPGQAFKIIGCHTDSPNLRVKPRSKRSNNFGCHQIGVECYGGGLWHTWFDRDLGISGRVLVRTDGPVTTSTADVSLSTSPSFAATTEGESETVEQSEITPTTWTTQRIEQRLVKVDRSLLRISNLAIHLQSTKEREAFAVNKEDDLSPIIALEAKKALEMKPKGVDTSQISKPQDGWTEHQEPALLEVLAHELKVNVTDIVDFELSLFDIQKASLGGAFSEFIHSARLDNLASCFLALQALVDHVREGKSMDDKDISMIVLYDHEEVGSGSAVGAASTITRDTLRRITAALTPTYSTTSISDGKTIRLDLDTYNACVRRSFVLSSDQAHAVHPNYASKHEKSHQPRMNGGMVIKRNSNQRYATNMITGAIMREIARRAGLPPIQEFLVRQDCGCGSTIGPAISAQTGIRTIDMGCPQLSMHSIRETMGVADLTSGLNLFKAFFEHYSAVDASIEQ